MNSDSTLSLESQIEAVLFYLAEPISLKELTRILKADQGKIELALSQLKLDLANRGIGLMELNEEYVLTTTGNASSLIEELIKEENSRDLGKASLETLAIILYQGPISRTRIDYIRGVNSGYILRHLLTRGLIAKSENQKGERSTVYEPTADLLAHLGLTNLADLPDKDAILTKIATFEEELANDSKTETATPTPQGNEPKTGD